MVFVLLYLVLPVSETAFAARDASPPAPQSEQNWARLVEETYYSYLEAELKVWKTERRSSSLELTALSTGEVEDLGEAREDFSEAQAKLFEVMEEAKNSPLSTIKTLSKNIQARLDNSFKEQKSDSAPELSDLLWQRHSPQLAQKFSPLRWQAIRDIYGQSAQEKLMAQAFSIQEWNGATDNQAFAVPENTLVLWIQDPWINLRDQLNASIFTPYKDYFDQGFADQNFQWLREQGVRVVPISLSTFDSEESQAKELFHELKIRYLSPDQDNLIIVSSGQASSLVYSLLDINPELRNEKRILAWINYNGRLHGMPLRTSIDRNAKKYAMIKKGRAIASVATPVELNPENGNFEKLTNGQMERDQPLLPLGQGFPIYSFVAKQTNRRSSPELHDGIISDGQNFYIESNLQNQNSLLRELVLKSSSK